MYRIITENGDDAFKEGRVYDKMTAESLWSEYDGIIEDCNGNDVRIYIAAVD